MSWFKVDDKLATHPKVLAAGNSALGLWIRAASWSRGQQTNGYIPASMASALGGKPSDVRSLVTAGLWEKIDGGYRFHDWQDYQPTNDEEAASKTDRTQRGKLGAHRRWHTDNPSPTCPYCANRR